MVRELVSIITPMFNSEKYINQTIESVIQQTYKNWEMIIVDDCSTDRSSEIVLKYSKRDNRIKYFRLEQNSGAAVARNYAMERAKGNYIAFLDSDDLWFAEKLEKQIGFMQDNSISFSFSEYCVVDHDSNMVKARISSPATISYRGLLSGYPLMCSSVIINRNKIPDVKMPNIRSGQDYATWAQILRNKTHYAYNEGSVLAKYRKLKVSLSANKLRALQRTWSINRNILKTSISTNIVYITMYSMRWIFKHYL